MVEVEEGLGIHRLAREEEREEEKEKLRLDDLKPSCYVLDRRNKFRGVGWNRPLMLAHVVS